MVPFTIPSPPIDWQVFYVGSWLHSWIPAWPENWTLPVHTYALCILAGIIAALLITNRRMVRRGAEPWIIIDISLWAIVLGIAGARFYHVVTHIDDYFGPGKNTWNPLQAGAVWNIWDGGNAIFGALIFGALGIYIGSRFAGVRFWSVADALAPTLLVAQSLGRLGNYFNHELYGLPTNLPWGLEIESTNAAYPSGLPTSGVYFHPTFLYEIIWNLSGFVLILLIENKVTWVASRAGGARVPHLTRKASWQWGKVLGLYLIWYGAGRSWFESIRVDPSQSFLGIRDNVWGALAAVVLGIVIIAVQTRRHPGAEPSFYLPGRQWTPPAAVDSEEFYSDTDESGDDAEAGSRETGAPATSGAAHPS
ncbi:prolipoprotein diacylglyceryl transferase [Lysinimonas soli]|uniref:Phosphatidylglycerol--prolipoprotein diacylglyceryl transferase n=1 Tax=Lysinimonas soli TaxID=1074233 RepID=A0ABW0NR05_9MICO